MNKNMPPVGPPIPARVVHRSHIVGPSGPQSVIRLMLNLVPGDQAFAAGMDIGFALPEVGSQLAVGALRRYTIDALGQVPFEESVDITLHVRADCDAVGGVAGYLAGLDLGDLVPVYGPLPYPFYPPMGSRSNMLLIGAGCGVVPFRWLARNVHSRKLDWMGKVLILHGQETGLESLYQNDPDLDRAQFFDTPTQRAFEALKTRYSALTMDHRNDAEAHREALWRLMGQGSVYVYVAGYRQVAQAMDSAMASHLRLAGRWQEAKDALLRNGHWQECLYD